MKLSKIAVTSGMGGDWLINRGLCYVTLNCVVSDEYFVSNGNCQLIDIQSSRIR